MAAKGKLRPSITGSIGGSICHKHDYRSDSWQGQVLLGLKLKGCNLTAAGSPIAFRPRDDRIGLELSPDNAQAILPPNACVFVAK